ncbi:MAG: phage minor head protein [Paracoccaceae bacterium]
MADLTATFRRPFAEQVAAFRLRLGDLVPTQAWDDIQRSAHDRAFMVAGATKADLLADLAGAVDKAIADGTSLEEFRRDFRAIVEKHGWHGWTGEGSKRGEAWRTRVIYRTNAATTYAAGRLAQLREGGFKYYVYRHGGSLEPRLQHLSWDGLILPADHPFWEKAYPPNGWGCSCYVIGARSIAGAKRVGGDPSKTLQPGWDKLDPATGTPKGIGKGWDYAPGASASDTITDLSDKLDKLPPRPSIDLIQSWLTENLFGAWFQNPTGLWPLARLRDEHAEALGAKTAIAKMSPQTAAKQLEEHPELTIFDYAEAQRVVSQATHVIEDDGSLVFWFEPAGANGHVLVVKATKSGEGLFVTSFRRISAIQKYRDSEFRRLMRKSKR